MPGNHPDGVNGVHQVNGELGLGAHIHQAGWVGGNSHKGTVALGSTLSLERVAPIAAPPALVLKLVNVFPPNTPLALFKLLPLPWSLEPVGLSERVCARSF